MAALARKTQVTHGSRWAGGAALAVLLGIVVAASGGAGIAPPDAQSQARPEAQPSASRQFQEAVTLMDLRGDYAAALRLFEKVAASSNRRLAGQATFYRGVCYERLGVREAAAAYRQVIDKFPDQVTLVQEARRRLASLGASVPARSQGLVTLRPAWKAWPEHGMMLGSVAADGRVTAFRADDDPELMLVQTSTGETLRRADPRTAGEQGGIDVGLVPSPSGADVALSFETADGASELRIVRVETGAVRTVHRAAAGDNVQPVEWLHPDRLLVVTNGANGAARLGVLTMAADTVQPIVDAPLLPKGASLSPDGRFVVYDAPASREPDHRDIFIVPVAGGSPAVLVGGPADDIAPRWAHDGRRVVFVSDRGGSESLWAQLVSGGRADGRPQVLYQDIGRFSASLGVTPEGTYFYLRQTGLVDVYVVELDAQGRAASAPAEVAGRYIGSTMGSSFGPDGSLVYLTHMGFTDGLLGIRDLRGAERLVDTHMQSLRIPSWSPDGRSILVRGHDRGGRYGMHLVDPATGATTPLMTVPPQEETRLPWTGWGADAATLIVRRALPDGSLELRARARVTGDEQLLLAVAAPTRLGDIAVSRADGSIACVLQSDSGSTLEVRGPDGTARVLIRTSPSERINSPSWMPDNRQLVFIREQAPVGSGPLPFPSLWRLDVSSGAAESLGVSMDGLRNASISPDGRHLTFTAGWPVQEVWVLENALPALPGAASARIRR